MQIFVFDHYDKMSQVAAQFLASQLFQNPVSHIGLTAGKTPLGLYRELIKLYQDGQDIFSRAWYYNLEEALGCGPASPASYSTVLRELLLDHVGVSPDHIIMPNGLAEPPENECIRFDATLEALPSGGLDLQVLGIGTDGHIGCNRPGETLSAASHIVGLSRGRTGIAMGMGAIMRSKCLLMLANGEEKAQAVADMCHGAICSQCPATFLQLHKNTVVMLDRAAASLLPALH